MEELDRNPSESPNLVQAQWFVLLVQPGWESAVQKWAKETRGIDIFVPYRTEICQWRDRKKIKSKPLLPGYAIVDTVLDGSRSLISLPRVYGFLRSNGQPAFLTRDEVQSLKAISEQEVNAECWNEVHPGRPVRILNGPLAGCTGEVVTVKQAQFFTVTLPMLGRQIATEIDLSRVSVSLLPSSTSFIGQRQDNEVDRKRRSS